MIAVDTNVLLYASDPRDLRKQDSLIVAQCLVGDATELLTEDFDAYSEIDRVTINNPFKS